MSLSQVIVSRPVDIDSVVSRRWNELFGSSVERFSTAFDLDSILLGVKSRFAMIPVVYFQPFMTSCCSAHLDFQT